MKGARSLSLTVVFVATLAGGFGIGKMTTAPSAEASAAHRYTLRIGDKATVPAVRQLCAVYREGGSPELFCARPRHARHQVTILQDSIGVWKAGHPDAPRVVRQAVAEKLVDNPSTGAAELTSCPHVYSSRGREPSRVVEVRNIRWLGIPTERYAAMRALLQDVMGLGLNFEDPTTVEFATTEGDQVQLMAPGDPYFDFFREHANGPVPLFEVDDVHAARTELEAAGVEIIAELGRDKRWEWIHFRGPDGNLYELASRLRGEASPETAR